ncbi:hypothetical protein [Streptomyces murinus]|uniref:hypothetical protein n=1 Tax=Streptomyces murinus TaxID=33900 RepID=UPI0036E039AE
MKSEIKSLAQQYPGASHKFTAGRLEVTDTHKAITDAAVKLAREGVLTDVRWDPSRNLYALGHHSVPGLFEGAHALPHEYVYILPNSSYQYGRITAPQRSWS